MDEIKKWMAANASKRVAKPRRPRNQRAEHKFLRVQRGHRALQAAHMPAGTRRRQPTTALRERAVRPAPKPATEGRKIRDEFKSWREERLKTYAAEHDLYTKTQFCNSRATAHSPSIAELQRAFGADWQDVPPRVASLAAVDGCMQALGLRAKDASTPDVWHEGPLKGKAAEVRSCAHGDSQVCAPGTGLRARIVAHLRCRVRILPASLCRTWFADSRVACMWVHRHARRLRTTRRRCDSSNT